MQQVLIIELHPKIMSALQQKYHNNFMFGNAHISTVRSSDILEFEFIVEMTVMKEEQPETVQMTFRRDDLYGYMVDHLNVIPTKKQD